MTAFLSALMIFLLLVMCLFLICLVLIQRGKGGGLAGAFGGGGAGGSSAFGSKAGDVFTRVTMITAGIWIALNMVLVVLSNQRTSAWGDTPTSGSVDKSAFSPDPAKNATGKQAPPPTGAGAAANPFDALTPANPNAPAPNPLGKGGTTAPVTPAPAGTPTGAAVPSAAPLPAPPAAAPAPALKVEMPDPFSAGPGAPASPLPAGSTPSGGSNNKP